MCMFLSSFFVLSHYKAFLVSSDNEFGFECGLSSSHAIHTAKSVVNEYSGILSGDLLSGSHLYFPYLSAYQSYSKRYWLFIMHDLLTHYTIKALYLYIYYVPTQWRYEYK